MKKNKIIYIYEMPKRCHYLFSEIFPKALSIHASIGDSYENVLEQVGNAGGWFLFHIDLTNTERFLNKRRLLCSELRKRGIIPLNSSITDISKKTVQKACSILNLNGTLASLSGQSEELLIVKTNRNYGGLMEKTLFESEKRKLGIQVNPINLNFAYCVMMRKEIPGEIWNNKDYIIEKYVANKIDIIYRVYKLINQLIVSEVIDHRLIKKVSTGIPRVNYFFNLSDIKTQYSFDGISFDGLIKSITSFCSYFKLDYGSMDVVRNDRGDFYIIDLNVTPSWIDPEYEIIPKFLSEGLA
jgi:hypothetical protein